MREVIDTPELVAYITSYLSKHDLAHCCSVSSFWLDAFAPHLWYSITITRPQFQFGALNFKTPEGRAPNFNTPEGRAALVRNGGHIRVLRTWSIRTLEPLVEHGETCTRLVTLDAEFRDDYPFVQSFGVPPPVLGPTASSSFETQVTPSLFGAQATSGFGLLNPSASTAPASLGFGAPATQPAAVTDPLTYSETETSYESDSILISIMKRNPQLLTLVIPTELFSSEVLFRVIAESLPLLQEFCTHRQLLDWLHSQVRRIVSPHHYITRETASEKFSIRLREEFQFWRNYPIFEKYALDTLSGIRFEELHIHYMVVFLEVPLDGNDKAFLEEEAKRESCNITFKYLPGKFSLEEYRAINSSIEGSLFFFFVYQGPGPLRCYADGERKTMSVGLGSVIWAIGHLVIGNLSFDEIGNNLDTSDEEDEDGDLEVSSDETE